MSRIQDLKKVGDNGFNIIDLLSIFNSTGKSKYIETLLRIVKNKKSNINRSEYMMELKHQYQLSEDFLNGLSNLQLVLYANILPSLISGSDATFFKKFCELNERGLIEENDLSKYNSFDEDPKSPGSVISTPRSPYPELRIKIPVEKEIIFDDDNNYRNKKYKKNRLC